VAYRDRMAYLSNWLGVPSFFVHEHSVETGWIARRSWTVSSRALVNATDVDSGRRSGHARMP
jgi:hypothetical protein